MITTLGLIDWSEIISNLKTKNGSLRHVDQTIDNNKTNLKTYSEIINLGLVPWEFSREPFKEMVKNYYQNNLDFSKIQFQNYYPDLQQYPEKHFTKNIVEIFENIVGQQVQECWISKVDADCTVPFHKDEFDKEQEWISKENKNLSRYMVFIDVPIKDQTFYVGSETYEMIPTHTIVKWPTTKESHSLVNRSNQPNFIFHFLGYSI